MDKNTTVVNIHFTHKKFTCYSNQDNTPTQKHATFAYAQNCNSRIMLRIW